MASYEWLILAVGVVLQVLVLSAMLGGMIRRYPFIFLYLVVSILGTVVNISFKYYFGPRSREFSRAYWLGDFVGTLLVLLVIIHLIRQAMHSHARRDAVYGGLVLGVLTTGLVSVFLVRSYSDGFKLGSWLTEVGRNYYFGAVLLNAILWFTLVRANHRNKQLYLLTSGLGLKLCGAAIAHGLRVANGPLVAANFILVLTYLLSLYVWYIALKRLPAPLPVAGDELRPSAAP